MSPRGGRVSATRCGVLIDHGVHVFAKTPRRDTRRSGKNGHNGCRRHEHTLPQRQQLANRHTVARDNEGTALIQSPHDAPAVIAELSLSDVPWH